MPQGGRGEVPVWVDAAVGSVSVAAGLTGLAVRTTAVAVRPAAAMAARVPFVSRVPGPRTAVAALARVGAARRPALAREVGGLLDALVPRVLDDVLQRAGLTELVLRHVDLDAVVAAVDLDAAAGRLDVDRVVARADLDAVAARLDVEAVLDRLDLTEVVLRRVDLERLVEVVLAAVDLDAVAARLDVEAVLNRLDLTELVLSRVDLGRLVDAVLAHVDLVGIAEDVIDAVDLPDIIRESTGSMASDTVRGARMQSIAADEALGRAVDRLLLRRGRARAPVSEGADGSPQLPRQRDRDT